MPDQLERRGCPRGMDSGFFLLNALHCRVVGEATLLDGLFAGRVPARRSVRY